MNTFLSKISKLDSVQDVILLSTLGEPLFFIQKNSKAESETNTLFNWNTVLSELTQPQAAEFVFQNGTYYVVRTDIGYIIIGLTDDSTLKMVKQSCATILTKLSQPTLCKRVLLNLLSNSEDTLKINIIKELVPYADKEVASVLIFLLRKEMGAALASKQPLLLLICQVLGYCSSYDAIPALTNFLNDRRPEENIQGNDIFEAVRISLQQLKSNKTEQVTAPPPVSESPNTIKNTQKNKLKQPVSTKKQVPAPPTLPRQQEIKELLNKGMKDEALEIITALIKSSANTKEFETAYQLRDWLIEINPMALTEIIHSAELIEGAKQSAIQKEHLETWHELADMLSDEEFSSLYHAMTLKTYPKGQAIVQQGSQARILLFINNGHVRIQSATQGGLVPLQVKDAGNIIGAGVFFTASVWTIQAKSLGCELFLLPRKKLEALQKYHPSIESKLFDFCSKFPSTSDQLKKSRKNRRQYARRAVSGRIAFMVLDKNGKEFSTEAKGNLLDISTGGLAFSIHSSQKKNAIALFGRQLKVYINTGITSEVLSRQGTVQAVRDVDLIGNEYSLHLEFSKKLTGSEMHKVINNQKSSM